MLTLYTDPNTISATVHVLLSELGVPFEVVYVDRTADSFRNYRTPDFLGINPKGLVPVITRDDFILTELGAIVLFIRSLAKKRHDIFPPKGEVELRTVEFLSWLSTSVHRTIGAIFRPEHLAFDENIRKEISKYAIRLLPDQFLEIERFVASFDWWTDQLTIIDAYLIPYFNWGTGLAISMERYPTWRARMRLNLERPSVIQATYCPS
ncbi:hypothetical protein HKD31_12330 [Gluconobacter sp. R71646]|uniref:GST N-terminal domain-containing protein n=4 Tax=Acetobacteraceae TaxID=433 RepID=A0A252EJL1_9PROT|nr:MULTISPECIES: glutathione S-transferase N-terminal domain-containing protein [Acetobacteraceae]ATJ91643.1 hypothetical protein CIW82_14035 [Acetobacter tropicalis]MBF0865372.1 hypothetical protein [Gluconobacter sp. R71656]MBF0868862.1 hypothetical protein [Gluconobacter sp. R75628]MBF0874861.1 hypothetical protein [Gluconobacter sp. R75629]MBF0883523.1 hypothetical protein [Gluconobacter potus]OUL66442.1 hypothetical protein HK16_10020 [Acetobacter senegalensis]